MNGEHKWIDKRTFLVTYILRACKIADSTENVYASLSYFRQLLSNLEICLFLHLGQASATFKYQESVLGGLSSGSRQPSEPESLAASSCAHKKRLARDPDLLNTCQPVSHSPSASRIDCLSLDKLTTYLGRLERLYERGAHVRKTYRGIRRWPQTAKRRVVSSTRGVVGGRRENQEKGNGKTRSGKTNHLLQRRFGDLK